ncbi:MAG: T9SS type A sorting domain-containing protein [Saprospiraceae bacterium]
MKNTILRFFAFFLLCFLTAQAARAQQCTYQLNMHDDFGDGWNGGVLTVTNGTSTYKFSLVDVDVLGNGTDSTVTFSVTDGLPLTLSWAAGGFDYEVSYTLLDNDGEVIFEITEPAVGVNYSEPVACVACIKPQNEQIENVYDDRAKVRWTPGIGTSTPAGWWVVYGPAGFGAGTGDTLYVITPKATITGLQKKTLYDFYVQQDCLNGDAGALVGPFTFETYRSNDVGISAVISPQNNCDLGVETVRFALSNFGAKPQSLVRYKYSVNGIPVGIPFPQDGLYTDILGKDSTEIIEFETQYDFSQPGEYKIAVWAELDSDEFPDNDTFYYYVVNRLVAPYTQNFETWSGGWYAGKPDTVDTDASWAFGQPAGSVISTAANGQNAWVTNLSGAYNLDEFSYLYSPCFDFSDLTEDPVLEFSLNYDTELEFDGGWLEMSLDDGANWLKVGAIDEGLNWYNYENTFTDLGEVWAGNSDGWLTARHRLDGVGGEARVHLRFVFSADDFVQGEGIGIDDVRIYLPVANDLAGIGLATLADDQECGLADDAVVFRIANFGAQPQTVFQVGYSLNGTAPVIENVGPLALNPDEVLEYTFNQTFDSRDGVFAIQAWTVLAGEQNPSNDSSAVHTVNHLPAPLPLFENFESGLLPPGWASNGFISNGHNNISQVLAINLYEFNPASITNLPRLGFVAPTDSLRFDYRITNFDGGGVIPTVLTGGTKFDVQVSTDCGETFQTIYTINSSNHTPGAGLKNVAVGLADYAGQGINIRFRGTWGAGDFYFDLDNINIGPVSTPVHTIDVLTSLRLFPNPAIGSATLSAVFARPIDVRVQLLDLTGRTLWQTGQLHTEQFSSELSLTNLPPGIYLVQVQAEGQAEVRKLVVGR